MRVQEETEIRITSDKSLDISATNERKASHKILQHYDLKLEDFSINQINGMQFRFKKIFAKIKVSNDQQIFSRSIFELCQEVFKRSNETAIEIYISNLTIIYLS